MNDRPKTVEGWLDTLDAAYAYLAECRRVHDRVFRTNAGDERDFFHADRMREREDAVLNLALAVDETERVKTAVTLVAPTVRRAGKMRTNDRTETDAQVHPDAPDSYSGA